MPSHAEAPWKETDHWTATLLEGTHEFTIALNEEFQTYKSDLFSLSLGSSGHIGMLATGEGLEDIYE